MSDLSDRILGETPGPLRLPDPNAIRAAASHMIHQATREGWIFSHDLDAPLYDNHDFLEGIRRLALRGPHVPVRVLLFDAEPAVRKGHRLIELARRLTSRIQIRRIPPELNRHTEAFLLADGRGYVLRPRADVYAGTADFDAPLEARRLRELFDNIWALSDIHQELRRLSL